MSNRNDMTLTYFKILYDMSHYDIVLYRTFDVHSPSKYYLKINLPAIFERVEVAYNPNLSNQATNSSST